VEKDRPRLFTIGYSDFSPEQFRHLLQSEGVELLADVRANPVSRKPGFSKQRLAEMLSADGIEYQSWPLLGIPSTDRKNAASKAGWEQLLADYGRSLEQDNGRVTAARSLANHARSRVTAVMCMESDLSHCHRKPLAEWIGSRMGFEVVHLGASER
jgi:uncharacterized protein (DUF488 family)